MHGGYDIKRDPLYYTTLDRRKRKRLYTDTDAREVLGSLSGPHILQSMLQDAYAFCTVTAKETYVD